MGRSDSSKPMPDGRPRQYFGGSHVSPRDQVCDQSGVRGGGARTRRNLTHAHQCGMACHSLAPCRCSRTSSVRLGHIPRDDKGKVGCTGKLSSYGYKTLTLAAGKGDALSPSISLFSSEPQTLLSREDHSGFLLTWASEGPLWVTPPISNEASVQDHHPRDGPRDKPTQVVTFWPVVGSNKSYQDS
ncbi:hypothetical protein B296_00051686 [Ensete ventricosum]|uniref:Uncharacterized protein n=1 Tax=Ensete ventricosum TaxID=4639 RepID=A0A426X0H5_ENSVE|nr:hypothetical protein B296_00051686 [Ensete ventricosum]